MTPEIVLRERLAAWQETAASLGPRRRWKSCFDWRLGFASKIRVNAETGCWEWTAGLNAYGYGVYRRQREHHMAHRAAYEWMVGQIPDGLDLDHLCRNRGCVNPAHLEPVTRRENVLRGASVSVRNAAVTHCPRGHEYTPENTYHQPSKPRSRICRTCQRERPREQQARARTMRAVA